MSSNLLLNSMDRIKEKSIDAIIIDLKNIQKVLKNKTNTVKNKDKINDTFKYKKNLINLEKSYNDSLILLDILKKHQEKNIFEKYDVKNIILLEKNTEKLINEINNNSIENILMKKKFPIIPLPLFSIVH